ncbi:hypothetical protein LSCM1_02187 [Leishmania martiniquensis]|uniref:DNA-directed DNA polymerase n=1 Tax=Leishmania martiniquensis TaxID=1580590 RepID=A0A836G568_9TRYP|nr:hypothetical protein LSCM1_02187 [Leishmania martiniquensis]
MDPFQRTADVTSQAFRVVPMTHLTSTTGAYLSGSAWSIPGGRAPSRSDIKAPPMDVLPPGISQSDPTEPMHSSFHEPPEMEATARNVRKWREFGLQIGSAAMVPLSPPLERHAQLLQKSACRRPEQSALPNSSFLQRQRPCLRSVEEKGTVQLSLPRRCSGAAPPVLSSHSGQRGEHADAWPISDVPFKARAAASSTRNDVVVVSDNDENGTNGGSAARQRQAEAAPSPDTSSTRVSPQAPTTLPKDAPDTSDDVCADFALQLQLQLSRLSKEVQHSTEEQRCGPPRRNGSANVEGGASLSAAKRWSGKKRTKNAKTAYNDDGDEEAGAAEGSARDETRMAMQDRSTSCSGGRGKSAARRRGRGGTSTAADAPTEPRKRKMRRRSEGDVIVPGTMGPSVSAAAAPRTLFSLTSAEAAESAMTELQSGPTAAATVSVPYIYLHDSAEGLFSDVRRALNDPDRIQAPPLFVGVSALSSSSNAAGALATVERRTNFTCYSSGAKTTKRRVSCCFSSLDPVRSHQHVELFLIRWKDDVYALPAQTVGLAFLCRVLKELPGVELITFNAQVLLVTLLAYCKGTLWSHCVSDVRVMAWMAQLHVASALLKAPSSVHALAGGGFATHADGATDADTSVLYDYGQLLLRVCGGKPPPTVVLEKTSNVGCASHSTSSFTESAGTAAAATAPTPPLTSAERQLAHQVYYLATVYRSLYGLLGSKGLLQAFLRQEKRIALLLALLKYNGMRVDLHEVHRYQKSCEAEMARQRSLANKLVPELGEDFNIQSHDQCRKVLYEVLQLGKYLLNSVSGEVAGATGLAITKGGRLSTAEETLRVLAQHHEFPACLLRYRKVSKLMQTYVAGMMGYAVVRDRGQTSPPPCRDDGARTNAMPPLLPSEAVEEEDDSPFVDHWLDTCSNGRSTSVVEPLAAGDRREGDEESNATPMDEVILPARGYATLHPNFLQEGTDTGRLSCVEPNLQNLPRNGITTALAGNSAQEDGEEDLLGFRRCFVAASGCVLLSIDYQQIELRVLAHLCGDAALIKALMTSADIHRAIAEVIFKKKSVSTEERSLAKRVVFGVLYGAGPKTLATHMGVTVDRALRITSLLTNAFPGIDTYHRRVIEEARANGFVRTLSGRLRYLPDIHSTVLSQRLYAERQAFNSVVQGSAADVMKMAMLAVSKEVLQRYDRSDVSLLCQVHDEIVFMVRKELLRTVVPLASSAMSHAMQLLVPMSVTIRFGPSLGDLHEWSVEHDLGVG